jgi:hypothetical protein
MSGMRSELEKAAQAFEQDAWKALRKGQRPGSEDITIQKFLNVSHFGLGPLLERLDVLLPPERRKENDLIRVHEEKEAEGLIEELDNLIGDMVDEMTKDIVREKTKLGGRMFRVPCFGI